jgi:GT2 family glycosyltransferase
MMEPGNTHPISTCAAATPHVMFVVVNWNQRQLTLDCLRSLYAQDYPTWGVVVVDNGSQDGTSDAVRNRFPMAIVEEAGANLGIAAGNNLGIRRALAEKPDYLFLLNNDTIVAPDMLAHLVTTAESSPNIGMTGPTMLYFDQPDTIWCTGGRVHKWTGGTTRLGANHPLSSVSAAQPQEVEFTASCAVCIKSAVIAEVGVMDERYFMYYDETDWFARAASKGWRTLYVPKAKMWHRVAASTGGESPVVDYYMTRNVLLFLWKNRHGLGRLPAVAIAAMRSLLTVLAYTLHSRAGTRLPSRNARLLGFRDAILGRWGPMRPDVASSCTRSRTLETA